MQNPRLPILLPAAPRGIATFVFTLLLSIRALPKVHTSPDESPAKKTEAKILSAGVVTPTKSLAKTLSVPSVGTTKLPSFVITTSAKGTFTSLGVIIPKSIFVL